ncbi:MAG: ACT domain-containing protein, partial [Phascolarctobacterium sp.]|nr:ACT domain-containing protein [Phascolarctobacterium sp.]
AARNLIHHEGNRVSCTCFEEKRMCSSEKLCAPCYIRMQVTDQPGALAAIAAAFGAQNVSLRSVVQSRTVDGCAELVFITHSVSEFNLQMALQILKVLPVVKEICSIIRVEDNDLK